MLFLNIGFMVRKSNHVDRLISNNLGPDPQDFPRLARPSPRCGWVMVFFLRFEIFKNPPRTHWNCFVDQFLSFILEKGGSPKQTCSASFSGFHDSIMSFCYISQAKRKHGKWELALPHLENSMLVWCTDSSYFLSPSKQHTSEDIKVLSCNVIFLGQRKKPRVKGILTFSPKTTPTNNKGLTRGY